MTDYFDPGALKRFENVNFGNENTIANLEGSGLKASGTWSRFSAIGRQDPEKAENNKARTELLKSLGNAFGLQGMSEKNGKVTFTKGFMDSLEKILGRDVFKRSDFGISGAGGEVSSGRPLTQRDPIMNAVKTAGGWQFDPVLENGKPLVRPVTAADIDRIGPACMDIINGDA